MSIERVSPDVFDWSADDGPAADLRAILGAADRYDDVANLNEAALLQLKHRGLDSADLWLGDGGFALLRGGQVDIVVAPGRRHEGLGGELARLVAEAAGSLDRVEAWSHADHLAAERLAHRHGLERVRELWVLGRALDDSLPSVEPGPGVVVRTFADGDADADAIVEVNREAFAHHPEQGSMTREDFEQRTREEWFDPAGLFLAERDGRVLGFHWTKVHPDRTGEVYVVAVRPAEAGAGIGKLLTAAGLDHLRDLGLEEVRLYVEADNKPAIGIYRALGFEHLRTEAMYAGSPR